MSSIPPVIGKAATRVRAAIVLLAFLHSHVLMAQPPASSGTTLPKPAEFPMPAPKPPPLDPNPSPYRVGTQTPRELMEALALTRVNVGVDRDHEHAALATTAFLHTLYEKNPAIPRADALKAAGKVYEATDAYFNKFPNLKADGYEVLDRMLDTAFNAGDIGLTGNVSASQLYGFAKTAVVIPYKLHQYHEMDLNYARGKDALASRGGFEGAYFNWVDQRSFKSMLDNPQHLDAVSTFLEKWNKGSLKDPGLKLKSALPVDMKLPSLSWLPELADRAAGGTPAKPSSKTPGSHGAAVPADSHTLDDRSISERSFEFFKKELETTLRYLDEKTSYDHSGIIGELSPEQKAQKLAEIHRDLAPARMVADMFRAFAGDDKRARVAGAILDATISIMATKMALAANAISEGAATGGYVGAIIGLVIALIQILGDSGPTMDEIILKEIRELRKAVNYLIGEVADTRTLLNHEFRDARELVNMRFDTIEALLGAHFDRVEASQDQSLRALRGLELQLAEQKEDDRHLDRQKDFEEFTRRHLGRAEAIRSPEKFSDAMKHLLVCAAQRSRNVTWTGTANPGLRGEDWNERLVRSLGQGDLRNQVNVLYEAQSRLLGANLGSLPDVLKDITPATDGLSPVPNPRLWALCAQDYLDYAKEHPELYRGFDPDLRHLRAVLDAGHRFQVASSRLAPLSATGAKDVTPLLKIVDNYEKQIASLGAALEKQRSGAHPQFKGIDPGQTLEKLNVTIDPKIAFDNGIIRNCSTYSFGNKLSWPSGYADEFMPSPDKHEQYAKLIPKQAALAVQLKLGSLKFCFDDIGFIDEAVTYDYRTIDTRTRTRTGAPMMALRLQFTAKDGTESTLGWWKLQSDKRVAIKSEDQIVALPRNFGLGFGFPDGFDDMARLDGGTYRDSHPRDTDLSRAARAWRRSRWDDGNFKTVENPVDLRISWPEMEAVLDKAQPIFNPEKPKDGSTPPTPVLSPEEAARAAVLKRDKVEDTEVPKVLRGIGEIEASRNRLLLWEKTIRPLFEAAKDLRVKEMVHDLKKGEGELRDAMQALNGSRQLLVGSLWQAMGVSFEKDPELVRILSELPSAESIAAGLIKEKPEVLSDPEGLQTAFELKWAEKVKELREKLSVAARNKDAKWSHAAVADMMSQLEAQYLTKASTQKVKTLPESLRLNK